MMMIIARVYLLSLDKNSIIFGLIGSLIAQLTVDWKFLLTYVYDAIQTNTAVSHMSIISRHQFNNEGGGLS